jgi:uncharacterized protein YgiM (DUF1202 family)
MKFKAWLLSALAPLTALSVLAQASNLVPPPPAPVMAPPAVTAEPPAAKPAKVHKVRHKKEAPPATNTVTVLNPPVTAAVKCEVLDVRGQDSFIGEVLTHLKKGDTVTVLEEITHGRVHANQPSKWSRIVMPTNVSVWVSADYIDSETKAVRVKKVNVRGGPGENYSVVARLEKGTVVKDINKKDGWLEIETPTNAFAFVASEYLDKSPAAAPAPVEAAAPPPPPTPPPAPEPVVVNVPTETAPPKPAETAPAAPPAPVQTAPAGIAAPAPTAASQTDQELAAERKATAPEPSATPPAPTPAPAAAEQDAPRIVTREGFVHRTYNFQAPSGYVLHDIKTGVVIEYLQPPPGLKFKKFLGVRVRVTGAEFLDPEWPLTPVLHIQTIDLMP